MRWKKTAIAFHNYFQFCSREMVVLENNSDRNIVLSFSLQFSDNACLRCVVRSELFWLQRFSMRSVRRVFYDRIDYPRACTWGTSTTYVCQRRASDPRSSTDWNWRTDLVTVRCCCNHATMQRRSAQHHREIHRQVARSRRDKEPRVLPIRTSDTAV